MLREARSPHRSAWIAGPLLLGALIAACGPQPKKEEPARPIDPEIFLEYSKLLEKYIEALKLLRSESPGDWAEGKRKLEALNFAYFAEDRPLIEEFRKGNDLARKELGRRGQMLELVLVFTGPYKPATWENARKEMLALGEGAPEFLTISLLKLLLNGRFMATWSQIRQQLALIGDAAYETTAQLAKEKAARTPETPIWKQEDLVQVLMVLLEFGPRGRAVVAEIGRHRVWNVRKAVAKAIGDSVNAESADLLVAYLRDDADWQVKAAAAEAIGRLRPARLKLGPVLLERLKTERDAFVRHEIIKALGRVGYIGAIPDLIQALSLPNYDTVLLAMEALYSLTGERLTRIEQWQAWYSTKYEDWKKRQTP